MQGFFSEHWYLIVLGCFLLGNAAFWVGRYVRHGLMQNRRKQYEEETSFEEEMLRTLADPAPNGTMPPEDNPAFLPDGDPMNLTLDRLWNSGLVELHEGPFVIAPGLPLGELVTLHNRHTVLVCPPDTPLPALAPHLKIMDHVILVQKDGSAIVCRDLADFFAENLFGAKDAGTG